MPKNWEGLKRQQSIKETHLVTSLRWIHLECPCHAIRSQVFVLLGHANSTGIMGRLGVLGQREGAPAACGTHRPLSSSQPRRNDSFIVASLKISPHPHLLLFHIAFAKSFHFYKTPKVSGKQYLLFALKTKELCALL